MKQAARVDDTVRCAPIFCDSVMQMSPLIFKCRVNSPSVGSSADETRVALNRCGGINRQPTQTTPLILAGLDPSIQITIQIPARQHRPENTDMWYLKHSILGKCRRELQLCGYRALQRWRMFGGWTGASIALVTLTRKEKWMGSFLLDFVLLYKTSFVAKITVSVKTDWWADASPCSGVSDSERWIGCRRRVSVVPHLSAGGNKSNTRTFYYYIIRKHSDVSTSTAQNTWLTN